MPDDMPGPEEVSRSVVEAVNRRDYEAILAGIAPDATWDMSRFGLMSYSGHEALRAFFEDWIASFDAFELGFQDFRDFGNGVTFSVLFQRGRPHGGTGVVELPYATVVTWANGLMQGITSYRDLDEAGSDAERAARDG